MADNPRESPPTSSSRTGLTADFGAAMPPLSSQEGPLSSRDNPSPSSSSTNPPQQQPQHPPDIIMDPPPNRVKRFVFKSKKRFGGGPSEEAVNFLSPFPGGRARGQQERSSAEHDPDQMDVLEVVVPERIQASYGLYVWPCAPILAWYLFEHRHYLPGKRVLELGAGTALPGVVASLCGAHVTLTDSSKLTHCLDQCRRTAEVNGVGDRVRVVGLTWGLFLNNLTKLKGQVDLLIGSDCFYDPAVFEDLISTVAYILEYNPQAKFLSTYQERSADWSIEHLLAKWGLRCKHVPLSDLANSNEIDLLALTQDHTIHLLEITLKSSPPQAPEEQQIEDVEFS